MIKETVTYTDFNGVERTEDFYFNFTEAELAEMQLEIEGGLEDAIRQIVNSKDTPKIIDIFKNKIFLRAYGQKSPDGRRMIKTKEVVEEFTQTEAYSQLFMKYATSESALSDFINNVMPSSLKERVAEISNTTTNVVSLPANATDNNS